LRLYAGSEEQRCTDSNLLDNGLGFLHLKDYHPPKNIEVKEMNEKGMEPYMVNALGSRGVTRIQHETKMRNLANLGSKVIKMINHDKYTIRGEAGYYNPYTDTVETRE